MTRSLSADFPFQNKIDSRSQFSEYRGILFFVKKKLTLDEAVDRASAIFEDLLATLPADERQRRRDLLHDAVVQATEEVDIKSIMQCSQGSQTLTSFAESIKMSPGYISDVYSGKRNAGKKLLKALNVVDVDKQTSYRRWR